MFRISTLEPGLDASVPANWVLRQLVATREELQPKLRTWREAGFRVRFRDLEHDAAMRALPSPAELRRLDEESGWTATPRKAARKRTKKEDK